MKSLLPAALAAVALLCVTGCREEPALTGVTVWKDQKLVSETTAPEDLARIQELLKERKEESGGGLTFSRGYNYMVDVATVEGSSRWMYDRDGYCRLLTVKNSPVYRLGTSIEFNQLVGITR